MHGHRGTVRAKTNDTGLLSVKPQRCSRRSYRPQLLACDRKQKYRESRNNNRPGGYAAHGQNILPTRSRVCSTLEYVGPSFRKEPTLVFGGTMKRKERLEDLVMVAKYSVIGAAALTLYALSWVPFF